MEENNYQIGQEIIFTLRLYPRFKPQMVKGTIKAIPGPHYFIISYTHPRSKQVVEQGFAIAELEIE